MVISCTRTGRNQLFIFCSLVVFFTRFNSENPYSRERIESKIRFWGCWEHARNMLGTCSQHRFRTKPIKSRTGVVRLWWNVRYLQNSWYTDTDKVWARSDRFNWSSDGFQRIFARFRRFARLVTPFSEPFPQLQANRSPNSEVGGIKNWLLGPST